MSVFACVSVSLPVYICVCMSQVNQGIDVDVIVTEVQEISHKPDEVYGIIECLSPGTLKIELFGCQHICQLNWLTLGNQLEEVQLIEEERAESFWVSYPNGDMDTLPYKMTPPSFPLTSRTHTSY